MSVAQDHEVLIEVVDTIGNKWHPVIIYQLAAEDELGFNELLSRIPGITNRMLSHSLETLENEGIVSREVVESKPIRVRYSLTGRGRTVQEIIEAMLEYGYRYRNDAEFN